MSCTSDLLAQQRANLVAACRACVPEPFLNGFLHDFLYLRSVCTFLALHAWHTVMLAKSGMRIIVSINQYAEWWVLMRFSPCPCSQEPLCALLSVAISHMQKLLGNAEPAGGSDPRFPEVLWQIMQELFGPLSMRALEDDRYVRQTEGYLPKANVAFVDEIFKANSAILNTLLTVLNERLFDNGTDREQVPLLCLVSPS